MWTLSGFADEISPDVDVQLRTLAAETMRWLDLRGVWGKNVLDLSDSELAEFKARIDASGIRVATIGSPIGKIPITDPFPPERERLARALHIARAMDTPNVRVFSFFIPPDDDAATHADEVFTRMATLTRDAEAAGVTLLHENEKGIFGETPERCHQLLTAIDSPTLRAAWDPANFVELGIRPYSDGYALLRPFIAAVHVKDARFGSDRAVPAGEGDAEWRETLTALHSSGFAGVLSLEPHLASGGKFGGFSGPELWSTAARACKDLLREQGIAWT